MWVPTRSSFTSASVGPTETGPPSPIGAEVSRLGEGIAETGAIADGAMERTAAAIADMIAEARQLGVDGIAIVGTMGLRTATNSEAFQELIKKRTGLAIEVISAAEECRIAYLAARRRPG